MPHAYYRSLRSHVILTTVKIRRAITTSEPIFLRPSLLTVLFARVVFEEVVRYYC